MNKGKPVFMKKSLVQMRHIMPIFIGSIYKSQMRPFLKAFLFNLIKLNQMGYSQ